MEWLVKLTGDISDLEELSKALTDEKLKIYKSGDVYILTSSDFNEINDANIIRNKSKDILTFINTSSNIIRQLNKSIEIDGIVSIDRTEKSNQYIFPSSVSIKVGVGRPDVLINGQIQETNIYKDILSWVLLAEKDQEVAKVLKYLDSGIDDMATLYKVFEIIRQDIGGEQVIQDKGWVSRDDINSFRWTVNSPDAIGDKARHGVQKGNSPETPMSIKDAKSLILKLTKSWFKLKHRS